jgi:hypothetical protein
VNSEAAPKPTLPSTPAPSAGDSPSALACAVVTQYDASKNGLLVGSEATTLASVAVRALA